MTFTPNRITKLGLGAVLAGSLGLAACGSDAAKETDPAVSVSESAQTDAPVMDDVPTLATNAYGELGDGEGGEGGESGEGGIDIAVAAIDPVVYRAGLAITEAHVLAARDAFIAGRKDAAAEMFAHPVSEVLAQMEPVFLTLGVEPFEQQLMDASGAIYEGEDATAITGRAEAILETLNAAATKAPASEMTPAEVSAGVVADQIERAYQQYRAAQETDAYEPYLDGYGFYLTAADIYEREGAPIRKTNAALGDRIEMALNLLEAAYPSALRPDTLDADMAPLAAASSVILLETRR